MSPYNYNSSGNSNVFAVHGSNNPGNLNNANVNNTGVGVRPVISLGYR